MNTEQLTTLRNRKPLSLFDRKEKLLVKIQINRKESFVCWERWVSKDRQNWVNWNLYLSLKDVRNVLNSIRNAN